MSGFNGTPEDVGGIPIASVIVPGNKTPVATKGGPATTDSQGNPLAGVSMYGYSGDIVDLATLLTLAGTPGDANTVASLMGRLTKIRDLLNATLTVGGSVSVSNLPSVQRVDANSGDFPAGAITDLATLLTLSGTPTDANTVNSLMGRLTKIRDLLNLISYDNTTEIKVSIYGTNATGGDTAIGINGSGNLKTNINGVSAGVTFPGNAEAAIGGTTAPAKELLIAGKTNDGTPQYQPLPEGAGGRSVIIEGFAGGTAVPVSNASLPLPTGAATSAKQPALGTAGTPSADVLSVQGITSMTPLKTDGSGVTQPVSAASLPLPTGAAQESGGNLATLAGAVSSGKVQSNVAQIGGQAPTLDNTSIQAVSMRGKGSGTAGDTALLLDSSGHLLPDVIDRWARQVGQVDVARVLGAAMSLTNPMITADQGRLAAINGQLFSATTGKQTAPSGSTYPFALFSTVANTKNILIISLQIMCGSGTQHDVRLITTDPAFATAITAVNHKIGGAASSLTGANGDITTTNVAGATVGGTVLGGVFTGAGALDEFLSNGRAILIPAGTAGGIEVAITTGGANAYAVNAIWIEY